MYSVLLSGKKIVNKQLKTLGLKSTYAIFQESLWFLTSKCSCLSEPDQKLDQYNCQNGEMIKVTISKKGQNLNFLPFFSVIDEPDIPLRTPTDVINATIPIQESFYVIWTLFFIIFTEFFSELVPLGTISQKKFWYKKRQYHAKRVYRLEVRLDWIFCSKSYKLQFLLIFFFLKKSSSDKFQNISVYNSVISLHTN